MKKAAALNEVQTAFASVLFEIYEDFLPTRSLDLDLEGSGSGIEEAISFYWPRNRLPKRFAWAIREESFLTGEELAGSHRKRRCH